MAKKRAPVNKKRVPSDLIKYRGTRGGKRITIRGVTYEWPKPGCTLEVVCPVARAQLLANRRKFEEV